MTSGIAMILLLCGCSRRTPIRVLVMHQFDESLSSYKEFDETILKTFHQRGYEPDIRNFYMDLDDQNSDGWETRMLPMNDSLRKDNWEADLILAEGDRCFNNMHNRRNDTIPSWRDNVPVVYGGILFPDWNKAKQYPNTILITEELDIQRNINLANEIATSFNIDSANFNPNSIHIELDYYYHEDSLIRSLIQQETNHSPYVNNMDFHLDATDMDLLVSNFKDRIVISAYSAEIPASNTSRWPENLIDTLKSSQEIDMQVFYMNCWKYPILVVKKDIWSESFSGKSLTPQFTARKELFGGEKGNFIAGYFADYATIATDIVQTALNTLENEESKAISHSHTPKYYMDYNAMNKVGFKYEDYKGRFIIKNAPTSVSNPLVYWGTIYATIIFCILIIILCVWVFIYYRDRKIKRLTEQLKEERSIIKTALMMSSAKSITSTKSLLNFLNQMPEEEDAVIKDIIKSTHEPGEHRHAVRVYTIENGRKKWWNLLYAIKYNIGEEPLAIGFIIDIDKEVKAEEKMQTIEQVAAETKNTSSFLWTISHEIRTPLNAILGFCDILKVMGNNLEKEEIQYFKQSIDDNNRKLQKIVSDIQNYSRITSGKILFDIQQVAVDAFVAKCYKLTKGMFTAKGLHYINNEGRGNISINVDPEALKSVIYQLLDNANKFTNEGFVNIGWKYNLSKETVSIYVEDTGIGMSAKKLNALFDMFWKADTFVPGTGIGLNVAKAFTEQMGGTIQAISEKGVGTRIWVEFPAKISQ